MTTNQDLSDQLKCACATRDAYILQTKRLLEERNEFRRHAKIDAVTIRVLEAAAVAHKRICEQRIEYMTQADNHAAVIVAHEKRIADLTAERDHYEGAAQRLATDLDTLEAELRELDETTGDDDERTTS